MSSCELQRYHVNTWNRTNGTDMESATLSLVILNETQAANQTQCLNAPSQHCLWDAERGECSKDVSVIGLVFIAFGKLRRHTIVGSAKGCLPLNVQVLGIV